MTVNEADSSIWNISDIEGDSENWTLSSDVNMLNLLQTFSDNLLSNLNTSSRALEELITFSSEVSTKVNNTFNEFNMLSNAQFIESRVYEDDETHDVGSDILPDVKEEDTSDVIGARIKTSVEYGLTVLDAAYSVHGYSATSPDDTVEDADEDEEIIIEPNDPYTHRSLPYLIGSSEYCTDESVGITLLYQSDDESNKSEDEEDDDDDDDEEEEEEEEDANLPKTATQVLDSDEDSDEDSEAETEVRPASGVAVPRQPQLPNIRVPSSSESEEMFPETKSARTKVFDSIFDSTDEESEEEEETKPPAPTPSNPSTSTAVTREERSPSVLSVKSNKTPKGVPKGAISMFGGRTVFEGGAIKVIEDEESDGEETSAPLADPGSEDDEIRPPKTATVKKVKKIDSIFSDTDESDSEGLFATKNIQDNDKSANPVVSSTNKKTKSIPQKQAAVKPGSLFDFTDDEDDMQPKKAMTPQSAGQSKESSSKGAQKAPNFDLFDSNESDDDLQEEVKPAPAAQKKANPAPPKKEEKGLFDSSDEETDTSLFGSVKVLPTPGKKLPDLKKETPQKKEKAKKNDSFDQLFASSDDESSSPQLPSTPSKSNSSKPSNNVPTNKTSVASDKPTARTAKFDDIFGDSDDDDDDTFGFSTAPQKTGKSKSTPNQPPVIDKKKDVPKSSEQKAPAKAKADKFDDLFADSDDETEDIFSGTEDNKNKEKQQPEPANPLTDEPEKDDSKETAGKQTSRRKQEETSANSVADKLKARAAKFDDIFGDSDDDEDDDMFTTPAKPVEKIAAKHAVPQPTPEITEREVPPLEPEDKAEKAANKLKQRAAKFDDLFADSDDDEDGDIFSSQPTKRNVAPSEPVSIPTDREVNNSNKPAKSSVENASQPQTDKIKARSAKFDDLFADSDEDDDDIFADKNVEDTQKTKSGNNTSEPDLLAANKKSADISTPEVDPGTRSPETKSNIAKLQNNLNLSPDMLMGGPRPRKPKITENSVDEADKVEGEKITKDEIPKVDKFDDLFGDSDDEDDIFAGKTSKPPKTKDEEPTASEIESPSNPLFDSDSSPTIPESNTPKSNVAKLQSNLNISSEMLMGGSRPKKPKEPEIIEEPKSESIGTKTKARAAKFDDLFDGSDEEDMFSVPELPKNQDKPKISHSTTQADRTEPSSPEGVSGSNNEDKIKQRAAKFDDLFGDSDEDSEDIFAAEEKKNSHSVLSEETTKKPESPVQSTIEPDSGPIAQKSKASPNSNIAKLQNNLKFNPAMLMGGPRPPIHKQKEPTPESVSEADKPTNGEQETEKTSADPQNPKVLSSITKGRTKRGGRRPPSRAPNRTTPSSQPAPTFSQPTPTPSQLTEGTETNDQSGSLADSIPTPTVQSDKSEIQEEVKKPIIEDEDIFETPSLKFEDEDDIFATPPKTKPSRQKIAAVEDDDLFSALPEKKSSILKDDPGEEDDLFSAPTKSKCSNKKSNAAENVSTTSSSKMKEEEDELFSAPAKSRDQGKKKGKTKKILDDDLFGDDFDLFSDISAKPKQSKKDKKGTKAKKSEGSKSKDFIDPLFQ